jgi:hypothetical protein
MERRPFQPSRRLQSALECCAGTEQEQALPQVVVSAILSGIALGAQKMR